jgi:N-acetylglutamate synthase-like GNAT family acetyltransferase
VTVRLLPREDWHRLAGTELETVYPVLPDGSHVVVVEDGERIVGCWAAYPLVHVEGLWIDPAYRKNPRVAARLWRGMQATAAAMGARAVNTAAISPEVVGLLEHVGAVELPGRHFSMSIKSGDPSCQQQ